MRLAWLQMVLCTEFPTKGDRTITPGLHLSRFGTHFLPQYMRHLPYALCDHVQSFVQNAALAARGKGLAFRATSMQQTYGLRLKSRLFSNTSHERIFMTRRSSITLLLKSS